MDSDTRGDEMKGISAVGRENRLRPVTGDLVKLATARSQPEADFLHDLMLDDGVPAVVLRERGLKADVLVPDAFVARAPEAEIIPLPRSRASYRPSDLPPDGRCGVATAAATRGSSRSRRGGQRG
jgi:hypothetical protein